VNTSLFSLCFVVFNFLATATTTLVASAVSKQDRAAAGEVAWQAAGRALLLGCSVATLLWTNGSSALVAMGIDPSQQQLHALAMTYLVWR
jgi:MATE family multidrug resistance protein